MVLAFLHIVFLKIELHPPVIRKVHFLTIVFNSLDIDLHVFPKANFVFFCDLSIISILVMVSQIKISAYLNRYIDLLCPSHFMYKFLKGECFLFFFPKAFF